MLTSRYLSKRLHFESIRINELEIFVLSFRKYGRCDRDHQIIRLRDYLEFVFHLLCPLYFLHQLSLFLSLH